MRRSLRLVCLGLVAAILAGCSDSSATGSTDTPKEPAGHEMEDGKYVIHVSTNAFAPSELSVPVGATVLWKVDSGMHDVTEGMAGNTQSAWSSDDDGTKLYAGQTYEQTFTTPGDVHYRCAMHEQAGMVATLQIG